MGIVCRRKDAKKTDIRKGGGGRKYQKDVKARMLEIYIRK
jgi:hypothetical protein